LNNLRTMHIGFAAIAIIMILLTSGCATQYGQTIKDDFRDTFKIYAGVGDWFACGCKNNKPFSSRYWVGWHMEERWFKRPIFKNGIYFSGVSVVSVICTIGSFYI